MSRVQAELLRIAKERVFMIERELEARDWHPNDPLKASLERRLAEYRRSVWEREQFAK